MIAFATKGNQYDVKSTRGVYGITYNLIPKPNSSVTEDYGIGEYDFGYLIIDKKGRIRIKDISEGVMMHSVQTILRELQGI